jgi:cytochrome b561
MRQVHLDLLSLSMTSFATGVLGVFLAWVVVGPAQLNALILSIEIPLHIVGGIVVMAFAAVLRVWVLYPVLRYNPNPFTKELAAAFFKVWYLFLVPLVVIGNLLFYKDQALVKTAQYCIGMGFLIGSTTGILFLTALLAELWMLIRHKD